MLMFFASNTNKISASNLNELFFNSSLGLRQCVFTGKHRLAIFELQKSTFVNRCLTFNLNKIFLEVKALH